MLHGSTMLHAQVLFHSDAFNGGVVSGGFSVGTVGEGSGAFVMPVPADATIRQAWLFAGHLGDTLEAITITLNGDPFTFDSSTVVSPIWQSIYGGASAEHARDVTAWIDPADTLYTMEVPHQAHTINNTWTEFYLVINYERPGALPMNVDLWLNAEDAADSVTYALTTSAPMRTAADVGMAIVGGYASTYPDCERVAVNGTVLGSFYGPDSNSVDPSWGSMGALAYADRHLTGLGDDNADQAIAGTDVVSNLNAIVPDSSSSLTVDLVHCHAYNDNHVWLVLLGYASDLGDLSVVTRAPDPCTIGPMMPSPAMDMAWLRSACPLGPEWTIELLDLEGRSILRRPGNGTRAQLIPRGDLAAGTYLVRATGNGTSSTLRLVYVRDAAGR
ncbi:MAG: T9SS type A sorting domain-containing protein [Flavobacteriales bacterium]|nr:T9SS type A sorting domain-containing protein [Flavobacteriales bacterium]MCB9167492.1 T9SS type A sorting domain-containing protein [Flavobacteriales bacterium]